MAETVIWLFKAAAILAAGEIINERVGVWLFPKITGTAFPTGLITLSVICVWILAAAMVAAKLSYLLIKERLRSGRWCLRRCLATLDPLPPEQQDFWDQLHDINTRLDRHNREQLEIHRIIRQEFSASLNRSFGAETPDPNRATRLAHTREGRCYFCNTRDINSVLYRCGHWCTCFDCGNNLRRRRTFPKCPLCRAPIVDVVLST